MLDVSRRSWGRPEVPTQRCGAEGVNWSWQADDFTARPATILIAGSYQAAVVQNLDEAISLVPQTDGLHLIRVKGDEPTLYAFVHAEGQTMEVHARDLIIDDVSVALAGNADRLTLA